MPRLELRALAPTTYPKISWLVCDRYFYVYPQQSRWTDFPDIASCQRASGLEPYHIPAELLMLLQQMVKDGKGEEAYLELVAAKLRGDA